MMDKNGDNTISPDELLEVFSFNDNFDIDMAKEMIMDMFDGLQASARIDKTFLDYKYHYR